MPKLIVSANYLAKRNEVSSARIRTNIDDMLRTIELMPGVGSSLVPPSIVRRYGDGILKALVSPYCIIYEHDRDNDIVYVYDLLDCRFVQ